MNRKPIITEGVKYQFNSCNIVPILFGDKLQVCTTNRIWSYKDISDLKYGFGFSEIEVVYVGEEVFNRRIYNFRKYGLRADWNIPGIEKVWNIGRRKVITELLNFRYGAELRTKKIQVKISSINDIQIVTSSKWLVDEFRIIWKNSEHRYKIVEIKSIHID